MDFIKKAGRWPVDIASFKTVVVLWICAFLFYKYISNKFRRDPRLVAFAATLPGPSTVPVLGNGFDFFLGGPGMIFHIRSINTFQLVRLFYERKFEVEWQFVFDSPSGRGKKLSH